MDLFDYMQEQSMEKGHRLHQTAPDHIRGEIVGRQHIIGKRTNYFTGRSKADKLSSVIFYGPPGTGKTTLAKVIANTTSAEFYPDQRNDCG